MNGSSWQEERIPSFFKPTRRPPIAATDPGRSPSLCHYLHRKLRGKSLITSKLDQIIGVGQISRTKLLKQFGSLANLAEASEEALREAGLSERVVRQLRRELA